MKKRKRVKLPPLKRLQARADGLWRKMILADGTGCCQVCHKKESVSAHHIFHKGAHGRARYDRRNGLPICTGCHLRERFDPTLVVMAAVIYHREKFWDLSRDVENSRGPHRWTRERLNMVIIAMQVIPVPPIQLPCNFNPRSYQLPVMSAFEAGCRPAALVWHRRAGKDKVGLAVTSKELYQYPGVYWHLFPLLNQGRKILWDGRGRDGKPFLDAFPMEMRKRTLDQEMKIEFTNGSLWQVVGVDNVDALVGANPRGIVFSEWSLMDPLVWKLLQPILLENGGWAMFIYTPRGKNHGYTTFKVASRDPDWFCSLKTVRDTLRDSPGESGAPVILESDIDKIRREGDEEGNVPDEDTIQQEYYCSFSGNLQGAIYGTQMSMAEREGRIARVPWEPRFPVQTAWDLGLSDSMIVGCFQIIGREWRWINYYENKKMGNKVSKEGYEPGMLGAIKWLKEQPYTFDRHYAPHDASAGEISTGKSRKDFALQHGINLSVVQKFSPEDGIDAVRRQYSNMVFDERNCEPLINAARSYRYEWDEKKQSFSKKPFHDWASHGCDMMRCGVMGYIPPVAKNMPVVATGMDFNPLNYEKDLRGLPTEAAWDFDPFTGMPRR